MTCCSGRGKSCKSAEEMYVANKECPCTHTPLEMKISQMVKVVWSNLFPNTRIFTNESFRYQFRLQKSNFSELLLRSQCVRIIDSKYVIEIHIGGTYACFQLLCCHSMHSMSSRHCSALIVRPIGQLDRIQNHLGSEG